MILLIIQEYNTDHKYFPSPLEINILIHESMSFVSSNFVLYCTLSLLFIFDTGCSIDFVACNLFILLINISMNM